MRKTGKFELWCKGVDMVFVDIEHSDRKTKKYHLCPYSSKNVQQALSFNGTKERVKIIDNAIGRGVKV